MVSLFGANTADPLVGIPIANPAQCKQTSTGDSVFTSSLSAGTYYVVVHGDTDSDSGAYRLSVQPDTATSTPAATTSNSLNGVLNGEHRPA